jgi:hypothetical protein
MNLVQTFKSTVFNPSQTRVAHSGRQTELMKLTLLLAALLLAALNAQSQNSRYVTVMAFNGPTNIAVLAGETAEIVTCHHESINEPFITFYRPAILKDGYTIRGVPPGYPLSTGTVARGTVVAGPALIIDDGGGTILTVKITPDTYNVNKTIIVPPGTNQVLISLESSTNLVNWADSTNGVYGSPDFARFFRIRMGKPN